MKKLCIWCNEPHLFGAKTLDADRICNKCLKYWKTDIPNIKGDIMIIYSQPF